MKGAKSKVANMASTTDLILESCASLRLSSIPTEWADHVWQSEFCESSGLPEILQQQAPECEYFKEAFATLLHGCRRLLTTKEQSTSTNEGLWKLLADQTISPQVLVALLNSMIDSCDKTSPCNSKLESSVLAANVYIVILQLPGSGAYNIFHSVLFQKALDLMKFWPQKENNKRKRNAQDKAAKSKAQRMGGARPATVAEDDSDDMEEDEDSENSNSEYDAGSYGRPSSEEAVNRVKQKLLGLVQDAVLLLGEYPLKDSHQTLHHVIQLFVDMTRVDDGSDLHISFDVSRSAVHSVRSINLLAYVGLDLLCTTTHGSTGTNMCIVFKHLINNILMVYGGGSLPSSAAVPRQVQSIKEQAVAYVSHIAAKEDKASLKAVQVLVQHLCTKCPEKAEYRAIVTKAAVDIMRCLSAGQYNTLIEWINKYSRNAKIGYRVFALDLISLLIVEPERNTDSGEQQEPTDDPVPGSRAFLLAIVAARCSDRAPTVRAKALQCFSGCVTSQDQTLVDAVRQLLRLPLQNSSGCPPEPNSSQSRDKSFGAMIRRRTYDEKVGVRKVALQALEGVIQLDVTSLQRKDVEMVRDRCLDPALSVRKQAMLSLTSLLQQRPTCTMLHSLWLDGVLPLVMDRETTAQEKCLQVLEEVLLNNIVPYFRSTEDKHRLTWSLLETVASPAGQEVRRYIHYSCQHWAKHGKLTASRIKSLTSHIDTEHNKGAWLLMAELASSCNKLDHALVIKCWKNYTDGMRECDSETLGRVISVLGSSAAQLAADSAASLTDDLQRKLSKFDCAPDIIALVIATLCKASIDNLCADLLKASEQFLSDVVLSPDSANLDEELMVRHLFTVGEVAQLAPCRTTERLFMIVESMLITQPSDNKDTAPLKKCQLPPTVKAHAFVTFGKLCLQNQHLAKQCIAALARELETSEDAAIRNNVTVVMCDLCVRYTSLVDRYIPNIATGLRDTSPLVRRQTLTLLTHLLQEDFVKWKGSLFYHFITSLVDDEPELRKFADFCLVHLLLKRHPGMFFQHFVECIFHFNSYEKHKAYNKFAQTDREKKLFSLKGENNASKRSTIYRFLLSHMGDEDKFQLMGKLCQEVLGGITDGVITLDQEAGVILKDTLLILGSKEIKLSSMKSKAADDFADEGDMAGAAMVQARNKFLTQVLKKNMIENIIPIIIEIKHLLEKEKSPLLRDLMAYLKEVMKDYRTEVQDVLSADRQLANEIEFDLRKFEEEQKELEEQRKRQTPRIQSPASPRPPSANGSRSPQVFNFVTPQLRSGVATPPRSAGVNRTVLASKLTAPISPLAANRRHTIATNIFPHSPKDMAVQLASLKLTATPNGHPSKTPAKPQSLATKVLRRSARKAADLSQDGPQTVGGSQVVCDHGPPQEDPQGRTPLKPVNKGSGVSKGAEEESPERTKKISENQEMDRAASTPEGDQTHLSRISFCTNVTMTAPPSPIPTSLPIRVYPKRTKGVTPSWLPAKGTEGEDAAEQIICLPSPEQRLPKPRPWNIKSPGRKSQSTGDQNNNSISQRTRSRRIKK